MRQDTLARRISDGKPLSDAEKEQLFDIFAKGCQSNTRAAVGRALDYVPHIPSYGIYDRVHLDPIGYCAGQSYPDEIRTVRNCLIGR